MSSSKNKNQGKSSTIKLTKKDASKLYSDMLLIRRFEEKCAQLYGMGKILGFFTFIYRSGSCCNCF